MKYKRAENQLYVFADDQAPRYLTAALPLDYDTMCGADKFGNIFITRLPAELSAQVGVWGLLLLAHLVCCVCVGLYPCMEGGTGQQGCSSCMEGSTGLQGCSRAWRGAQGSRAVAVHGGGHRAAGL